MKKVFVIAASISVATLLVGLLVQLASAGIDAAPAKKMATKLGLSQVLWPLAMPVFGGVVMLLSYYSKNLTLRKKLDTDQAEKSDIIVGLSLLFGPVLAFIMQGGIALYALGVADKSDLMKASIAFAFVFFLAMGNYIGTTKRGSPIGLRTPWSLHDDRIWYKTQRFLGRGLVFLSMGGFASLFFYEPIRVFWVFLPLLITLKVLAAGYSYVLWRNEKHQHA